MAPFRSNLSLSSKTFHLIIRGTGFCQMMLAYRRQSIHSGADEQLFYGLETRFGTPPPSDTLKQNFEQGLPDFVQWR